MSNDDVRERPQILEGVTCASRAIEVLTSDADLWVSEEKLDSLARDLRPHLRAAAEVFSRYRKANAHREDRVDETIDQAMLRLRFCLR